MRNVTTSPAVLEAARAAVLTVTQVLAGFANDKTRAWFSADGELVAVAFDGVFRFDDAQVFQAAASAAVIEVRVGRPREDGNWLTSDLVDLYEAAALTGAMSGPRLDLALQVRGWPAGLMV